MVRVRDTEAAQGEGQGGGQGGGQGEGQGGGQGGGKMFSLVELYLAEDYGFIMNLSLEHVLLVAQF